MTSRRMISLLTVTCLIVLLTGCSSSQPVYSHDGRYLGHQQQVDHGKTLGAIGDFTLGLIPFGRNVQAARGVAVYGTALRAIGNATQHDNRNEVVHYVNVAR